MGIKVVFQNSGGLDSLVAAKVLHDQGYELHSVFIDFGQPSVERQRVSAKTIADRFCTVHETITVKSDLRDGFATSRHLSPEVTEQLPYRIPFGSTTTSVISSLVIVNEGIGYMASGTTGGMRKGVNQSTQRENLQRIFTDVSTTTQGGFVLTHPLNDLKTKQVIQKAYEIGLTKEDLDATVSCNLSEPCGKCVKCQNRIDNGIKAN